MHHGLSTLIFAAIILFGLYRRTRRTIGYQRFAKKRMLTRLALFAVVGVLVLAGGVIHPLSYVYDAAGIVVGAVLAFYAIRTTAFEWNENQVRYRPNPWIGIILLVLFFGRIVDRMFTTYKLVNSGVPVSGSTGQPVQMSAYGHDPFTSLVLFALVTYYVVYYTFVIRQVRRRTAGS